MGKGSIPKTKYIATTPLQSNLKTAGSIAGRRPDELPSHHDAGIFA